MKFIALFVVLFGTFVSEVIEANRLNDNLSVSMQKYIKDFVDVELKKAKLVLEKSMKSEPTERDFMVSGAVYIQFPGQPAPLSLWPLNCWSNITSTYAGLFFRAEGGDSLAFGALPGSIQSDLDNVLEEVEQQFSPQPASFTPTSISIPTDGSLSAAIAVNLGGGGNVDRESYATNGATEVRPINTAITLWQCTC